jgi:hypothetical protein
MKVFIASVFALTMMMLRSLNANVGVGVNVGGVDAGRVVNRVPRSGKKLSTSGRLRVNRRQGQIAREES